LHTPVHRPSAVTPVIKSAHRVRQKDLKPTVANTTRLLSKPAKSREGFRPDAHASDAWHRSLPKCACRHRIASVVRILKCTPDRCIQGGCVLCSTLWQFTHALHLTSSSAISSQRGLTKLLAADLRCSEPPGQARTNFERFVASPQQRAPAHAGHRCSKLTVHVSVTQKTEIDKRDT
jgi:hypothetical protein